MQLDPSVVPRMKFKSPCTTVLPLSHPVPVLCIRDHQGWPQRVLYSDDVIFNISVIVPMLILLLPMTYIDGNLVPTVIFDDQQYTFQAFLLCIVGACYSSAYSIVFRQSKPKIAGVAHTFAVAFIAIGITIFLWAATFSGFRSCLRLLLSVVA